MGGARHLENLTNFEPVNTTGADYLDESFSVETTGLSVWESQALTRIRSILWGRTTLNIPEL